MWAPCTRTLVYSGDHNTLSSAWCSQGGLCDATVKNSIPLLNFWCLKRQIYVSSLCVSIGFQQNGSGSLAAGGASAAWTWLVPVVEGRRGWQVCPGSYSSVLKWHMSLSHFSLAKANCVTMWEYIPWAGLWVQRIFPGGGCSHIVKSFKDSCGTNTNYF